jgi:hypothetical protein
MNTHRLLSWQTCTRLIAAWLMLFACGSAVANVSLWVSNHGTDSGGCGLPSNPCRSISQAIANAAAGDTIWVGAGHYGNVNGDIGFTGPGDEQPEPITTHFDPLENAYNGCIVCINKAVKIYSLDGAAATIIDSGPSPGIFNVTVALLSDGAVFGASGHGFTITGGNATGVLVDMQSWSSSTVGVTVSANVDLNDGTGFGVYGPEGYAPPNPCPLPVICPGYVGTVVLEGNEANNNGTGFFVTPRDASPTITGKVIQFILLDNLARGAGTGFDVEPGIVTDCDGCSAFTFANMVSTEHNFATNGGVGFAMRRAGLVKDNLASDNSQYGFLLVNSGPFLRNTAVGNAGPGVIIGLEAANQGFGSPPTFILPFAQNNFSSNDRNRPTLMLGDYGIPAFEYNPGPSAHCGVLDMGAVWEAYAFQSFSVPPTPPVPSVTLQATGNYWGSTSGPSSSGPGDAAGGACDQNDAITVTKPSATAEVTVTPVP